MRKALSLVLIAVFLVSFFSGMSVVPSAKAAVAQEVTYNLGVEPATIDPALTWQVKDFNVEVQVFDGLTRINNKNVPVPAIAKSWTISKDRKTYVFTLRDASWTNGMPVTAYDFEYAWKRALSPELAGPEAYQLYYVYGGQAFNTSIKVGSKYYAPMLDAKGNPVMKTVGGKQVAQPNMAKPIDPSKNVGVRALDAKTLKVYLQSPTAYFLNLTAFVTLMPVCKAVVSTNDKWASDPTNYVTDGPFKLTQWSHNEKMTFVKNPTYWDKNAVKLTKITYLMVTDESTALSMFQSGQMDVGSTVPLAELPKLVASGDAKILPYLGTYFSVFNVNKKPFNDVRVRKALCLAINRKAITTSITRGGEIPALAIVPHGLADAAAGSDFRTVGGHTSRTTISRLQRHSLLRPVIPMARASLPSHTSLTLPTQTNPSPRCTSRCGRRTLVSPAPSGARRWASTWMTGGTGTSMLGVELGSVTTWIPTRSSICGSRVAEPTRVLATATRRTTLSSQRPR